MPAPTTKNARLGPEDKERKKTMVAALKQRKLLSPNAERYIRSGIR